VVHGVGLSQLPGAWSDLCTDFVSVSRGATVHRGSNVNTHIAVRMNLDHCYEIQDPRVE